MSDEAVETSLRVQAVLDQAQAATRRPKLVVTGIPKEVFVEGISEEDMCTYVCLNSRSLPDKKPDLQTHTVLRHFDIYEIRYLYDRFHWAAFLPQTLEFDGPVLECLKYTRSDVPYETIRKNGHGVFYVLPEWMVKNLDGLWKIITALHRSLTRIRKIVFPLDTRTAPAPQSCGYDRLFCKPKDLKDTWIQTRAFFIFHLCYVSYLVCLCSSLKDIKADRPSWLTELEELNLIDTSIYDDLKGTWVFDLKIPRLGGFVDADIGAFLDSDGGRSALWTKYIPWIARRAPGVPFWLRYKADKDFPEDDDRFEVVKAFQPTPEELAAALQESIRKKEAADAQDERWSNGIYEEQEDINPEQHHTPTFSRITEHTAAQMNDIWGNPISRWGDAWVSQGIHPVKLSPPSMKQVALPRYMEQLQFWQQRMKALETPYQREQRMGREVAQQNQPVPCAGKPTVYLWENNLDDSWTWEVVGKRRVQEVWTDTTPYQRIYDPFCNVYHVSFHLPSYPEGTEVRPSITCYAEDEDDEDFMDIDNGPPQSFGVSVLETEHRPLTKEAPPNECPLPQTSSYKRMPQSYSSRLERRYRSRSPVRRGRSRSRTPMRRGRSRSLENHGPRCSPRTLPPQGNTSSSCAGTCKPMNVRSNALSDDQTMSLVEQIGQNSPFIEGESLTAGQNLVTVGQSPLLNKRGSALGAKDQHSLCDMHQPITVAAHLRPGPIKPLASPYRPLQDREIEPEDIQGVIKFYYGLHEAPVSILPPIILSWSEVERILCIMDDKEHVPAEMQRCVQLAVSSLKHSLPPPSEISDIALRSPYRHPMTMIEMSLDVVKVDGGYVINSVVTCDTDIDWRVFVPHASTLFDIARRGYLQSKPDIVAALLARGSSFRTIRETPALADKSTIPPTIKRTIVEPGIDFSFEDYVEYEERLKTILNQPRGRAALMKGGIVWRLALEVLSEDTVFVTAASPEEYKFSLNIGDHCFVDDELSESELDVIVGVYHVATSQRAFVADSDSGIVSWWPRHVAWQNSNYNMGYWNWKCELWFRNRRKSILEGGAKPMNQGKWRRALKANTGTGKIRHAWNTLCETTYNDGFPNKA